MWQNITEARSPEGPKIHPQGSHAPRIGIQHIEEFCYVQVISGHDDSSQSWSCFFGPFAAPSPVPVA